MAASEGDDCESWGYDSEDRNSIFSFFSGNEWEDDIPSPLDLSPFSGSSYLRAGGVSKKSRRTGGEEYVYVKRERIGKPLEQVILISFMDTSEIRFVHRVALEKMMLDSSRYIPMPLRNLFFGIKMDVVLQYIKSGAQPPSRTSILTYLLMRFIQENVSDCRLLTCLTSDTVIWKTIMVAGVKQGDVNHPDSWFNQQAKTAWDAQAKEDAANKDIVEDNYGVEEIRYANPRLFPKNPPPSSTASSRKRKE